MKARVLVLAATLALVAGCGKSEPPAQVDAAKQREEALERARHEAFGTQVKALDKAKGLQDELNKKVIDNMDKAEKDPSK